MFYRENGQFKTSYRTDQQIFPIAQDRWAILALEGAVWRQFTFMEMLTPCLILVTVGAACFALGTRGLREA